jgi:RNA polymerase sigma-70 factor (ECF subfamily)
MRIELTREGKLQYFDQFKGALTGGTASEDYTQATAALSITPDAAKQAAYRLRKRYRELFRAEVARTLACEQDVDEEIGRLLESLE